MRTMKEIGELDLSHTRSLIEPFHTIRFHLSKCLEMAVSLDPTKVVYCNARADRLTQDVCSDTPYRSDNCSSTDAIQAAPSNPG